MKSQICWCKYFFDFCWCGCINKIFWKMWKYRFFSIFDQNLSKINKIWGMTVSWAWSSYVNPFIWWVCHIHTTFWWFSEKCQKSRNFQKSQYWPITPLLLLRIDFLKKYVEYAHMRWDLGFSARIDVSKIFVCKNITFWNYEFFSNILKKMSFFSKNRCDITKLLMQTQKVAPPVAKMICLRGIDSLTKITSATDMVCQNMASNELCWGWNTNFSPISLIFNSLGNPLRIP